MKAYLISLADVCSRTLTVLFALACLSASVAWSQEIWSQGMTERQRFMVFPHMDAGFRALRQDRHSLAVKEFSRAVELAPNSPILTQYLAEALASGGETSKAIDVIDVQLLKTPDIQKLVEMRAAYAERISSETLRLAESLRKNPGDLRKLVRATKPEISSAYSESVWLRVLADASTQQEDFLDRYRVQFISNTDLKRQLTLMLSLRLGNGARASQIIADWPAAELKNVKEIDAITFQLISRGFSDQALQFLIKAYPFEGASASERGQLMSRMLSAQRSAKDKEPFLAFLSKQSQNITSSLKERDWLELTSQTVGEHLEAYIKYVVRFPSNIKFYESEVQRRIASGETLPSNVDWQMVIKNLGITGDTLLDPLTYRLIQAGDLSVAWRLLMTRYPFSGMYDDKRLRLLERLALIVETAPRLVSRADQVRLSMPLESSKMRRIQVSILTALKNCAGIRQVLGDFSREYTAIDWSVLGDCYQRQQLTGLAQYAFEKAVHLDPSPNNQRAVAFIAFQNKDYPLAIHSWLRLSQLREMRVEDYLPAAVTAIAASRIEDAQRWLADYAKAQGTLTAEYWTLKAQAESRGSLPLAIESMQQAIEMEPLADRYIELAKWQREAGDESGALSSLKRAVTLEPFNGVAQAELAFLLYRENDLVASNVHMVAALKVRPNDTRLIEQLAYINQQLGKNEQAQEYIKQSVDSLMRYPPQEITVEQKERLFSLRRMNEDLSRRWTLSLDALVGTAPVASTQSPVPGQDFKSYSQLELDYRLGNPAVNDGKTISAYARVFSGSGGQYSAVPIYDPVLGLGLRWKPFSSQVIYFAVEKQLPLDNGSSPASNTMLRVSASFLNSGKYSDDWRPTGEGWVAQNLYLDAAYYLANQAYALTADYRVGYHRKVAEGQTVEPYLRLIGSKVSNESSPDIRVGAGVRWNVWANQSRYSAYASRYYVGVELQRTIKTYQTDGFAGLMTLGVRW